MIEPGGPEYIEKNDGKKLLGLYGVFDRSDIDVAEKTVRAGDFCEADPAELLFHESKNRPFFGGESDPEEVTGEGEVEDYFFFFVHV